MEKYKWDKKQIFKEYKDCLIKLLNHKISKEEHEELLSKYDIDIFSSLDNYLEKNKELIKKIR